MFKFAFELELRTKIENAKIAYMYLRTLIIMLKCAMLAYHCMIVLMFFYL